MDRATLTELDGTPVARRLRPPIGVGRIAAIAICAVAIAVDLALRLLFVLPLWSDFTIEGTLPTILTGMAGGVAAFLVPTAFVLRSPDAWWRRRMLLVGALLGAGAELARSAGAAVSGLNLLQVNSGAEPTWGSLLPAADAVNQVGSLGGAVGTLLVALGLARLRERPTARFSRVVVAAALVAVGTLDLWGLRPLVSAPAEVRVADWAWTVPAVLAADILAALYLAWVIVTSWSAGERPRRAWTWAAAATCVGLVPLAIESLLSSGVIGRDAGPPVAMLDLVGICGGLLFVAAIADGLGASPARD
jgi:hypothetical protein